MDPPRLHCVAQHAKQVPVLVLEEFYLYDSLSFLWHNLTALESLTLNIDNNVDGKYFT